jgi:hypothetical protein
MSQPGADPFDELDTRAGPQPFAIGFEKSGGEALVYGSAVVGAILVLVGSVAAMPYLAAGAMIPLGLAFWHYPMVDRSQPQLGANRDGLFVERIGFIDWAAVQDIALSETAVRTIRLVTLDVTLTRPLPEAVSKPQSFPLWKQIMMRNWSVHRQPGGTDVLKVQLHSLTNDPEQILDRLRQFRGL